MVHFIYCLCKFIDTLTDVYRLTFTNWWWVRPGIVTHNLLGAHQVVARVTAVTDHCAESQFVTSVSGDHLIVSVVKIGERAATLGWFGADQRDISLSVDLFTCLIICTRFAETFKRLFC